MVREFKGGDSGGFGFAIEPIVERRFFFQVFRSARKYKSALMDEKDSISHFPNFLKDVGGEENRLAQTLNGLSDFHHLVGVKPGGRFVHDQYVRFM